MKIVWRFSLPILLILAACTPQAATPLPVPEPAASATAVSTELPASTPTPQPTATVEMLQPTQTAPMLDQVCSPLDLFSLNDLSGIISNPYQAPLPGLDDGHHGVDFAFYSYPALGLDRMKGLPIHAALAGRVIAINKDLTPYGYTVITETPLVQIPAEWQSLWNLPQPSPLETQVSPLSCPANDAPLAWSTDQNSLYLLYAHMDQPPEVSLGQDISCGQRLGVVGTSGASVNEHLHFEVRVGPSGARFSNFGHYDTATTEEDRSNYCIWRISGWFQLVDPMLLLNPRVD